MTHLLAHLVLPELKKQKGYKICKMFFIIISTTRVVTKISSFQANTKSRRGIKQLGIFFPSIFLPFSFESSRGPTLMVAGENSRPPTRNDSSEQQK